MMPFNMQAFQQQAMCQPQLTMCQPQIAYQQQCQPVQTVYQQQPQCQPQPQMTFQQPRFQQQCQPQPQMTFQQPQFQPQPTQYQIPSHCQPIAPPHCLPPQQPERPKKQKHKKQPQPKYSDPISEQPSYESTQSTIPAAPVQTYIPPAPQPTYQTYSPEPYVPQPHFPQPEPYIPPKPASPYIEPYVPAPYVPEPIQTVAQDPPYIAPRFSPEPLVAPAPRYSDPKPFIAPAPRYSDPRPFLPQTQYIPQPRYSQEIPIIAPKPPSPYIAPYNPPTVAPYIPPSVQTYTYEPEPVRIATPTIIEPYTYQRSRSSSRSASVIDSIDQSVDQSVPVSESESEDETPKEIVTKMTEREKHEMYKNNRQACNHPHHQPWYQPQMQHCQIQMPTPQCQQQFVSYNQCQPQMPFMQQYQQMPAYHAPNQCPLAYDQYFQSFQQFNYQQQMPMQSFGGYPQLSYMYPNQYQQECGQQQQLALTYEPTELPVTTANTSAPSQSIRQSQFSNLDTSQVESRMTQNNDNKSQLITSGGYAVEHSFIGDFSDIESTKNEIMNMPIFKDKNRSAAN